MQSDFEQQALELFGFQAERCAPYREYLQMTGVDPRSVARWQDIPCLPIGVFKSRKVYCGSTEAEMIFTSSTTSSSTPSRHYVEHLDNYRQCFTNGFRQFYGDSPVYALLPCYLEREGSSLVYMVDKLIETNGGGFFLHDFDALCTALRNDRREKILLGVSYALLDLAEQHPQHFEHTIIMETGGMKGHRKEMAKSELHARLCRTFGIGAIHSEYGMAELMSQAYSSGEGIFKCSDLMRVAVRDVNDPTERLGFGRRGALNIIDLGNRSSCAFIATDDMGIVYPDYSFELCGRIDHAAIRGCNLLVDN